MPIQVPSKDPNNIEPYHFIWCSQDGVNDGGAKDAGELQGETISSFTVTATGVTIDSSNKNAVSVQGVSYGASTVVTVWLSAGVEHVAAQVLCRIVTSGGRTLDQTMIIPIEEH